MFSPNSLSFFNFLHGYLPENGPCFTRCHVSTNNASKIPRM
jgi:hypothetical protein